MHKLLIQTLKTNSLRCPKVHGKFIVPHRNISTSGTMFKSAVFNLQEASKDQVQEFLDSFDTVLTDCDGKIHLQQLFVTDSLMKCER